MYMGLIYCTESVWSLFDSDLQVELLLMNDHTGINPCSDPLRKKNWKRGGVKP